MVQAARLAASCNYLSKKKKRYRLFYWKLKTIKKYFLITVYF